MRRLALTPDVGPRDRAGVGMHRVLIAVDFGAASIAAARWVARHLAPDAELLLVHVVPVPRAPAFLARALRPPDVFVGAVADPMRHGLEGLAAELGAARVRVELRVGEPAEQLATVAAAERVDLICVGGPRRRGRTTGLGRNTVDRLLRRATVPLLQAGGPCDAPPDAILAAADGGARSEPVLRAAWSLAARLEARLVALHVIDEDVRAYARAMAVAAGAAADAPIAEQALWGASARWLSRALEAAGARAHRAHVLVGRGDPGQEIVAACARARADVVVLGRTGHDSTERATVGTTTRAVLRDARCAVLVVPGMDPATAAPDDHRGRRASSLPALATAAAAGRRSGRGDLHGSNGGDVPPAARCRPA